MTLKLEVGKSYRRADGKRVYISRNNGHPFYPFISDEGLSYTEKGQYLSDVSSNFDLIAEWEEQPLSHGHARLPCGKVVDLTNPHGTAFGLLDEVYGAGTQEAMRAHGGPIERLTGEGGWRNSPSPCLFNSRTYRAAPKREPKVEELVLVGGKYDETLWDFENVSASKTWHTHRITLTLRDGVPDAVAKVEVMK